MRRYLVYMGYVLRHKWFVFLEACKLGIPWRGLVHDLDKLRPDEFIPYARFFHNPDGRKRQVRNRTGYYKPDDTGDAAFDFAWFLHQKRNRHHWQSFVFPLSAGGERIMPMQRADVLEMIADWRGAGRAQGTPDTIAWYCQNGDKLRLHPDTRVLVESLLERS